MQCLILQRWLTHTHTHVHFIYTFQVQTELKSVKEDKRLLQQQLDTKVHTLQQLEGIGMESLMLLNSYLCLYQWPIWFGGYLAQNTHNTLLISLLCTASTQNWVGMCPSWPTLGYTTGLYYILYSEKTRTLNTPHTSSCVILHHIQYKHL